MIATHEFAGVVTLECFGQLAEELKERGGVVIAQPQG